jgi:hemolysin D
MTMTMTIRLPWLTRRQPEDAFEEPVSAFESETQSMIQRTAPSSEHAVVYVLAGVILLSLLLMSVIKIDRVVTSVGRIKTTEGSLFVQPLDRSVIRDIDVVTGDIVTKGQVLARLDPTFATADLTQLTQKMESAQALVDRLSAERAGQPYTPTTGNDAEKLQASLWRQRQSEYQQNLAGFDAKINASQSTLSGAEQDAQLYGDRLAHAYTIEKMRTTLEQRGFGSKLNTVQAADSRTDITRLQTEAQSLAEQTRHSIDYLTAERGVFTEKWQDDAAGALVTAQNDLNQIRQELAKAQKVHDLVTLVAPEDAIVLKIAQASAGSVVSGSDAEPLFTLVPLRGKLEGQMDIDSKDIGFVQPGDHVEIKLDAYPFMRHGTLKGTIKTISEGSFTVGENQQARSPYFKARIEIADAQLRNVPSTFRLIPGMTAAGDVLVGRRTILSYLVEGALRTGSEAMREPS